MTSQRTMTCAGCGKVTDARTKVPARTAGHQPIREAHVCLRCLSVTICEAGESAGRLATDVEARQIYGNPKVVAAVAEKRRDQRRAAARWN